MAALRESELTLLSRGFSSSLPFGAMLVMVLPMLDLCSSWLYLIWIFESFSFDA